MCIRDRMNTQEIHAEGVLLIQRQLLKYDIKSEPMEAHAGIDFRAYVPNAGKVFTVVLRTSLRPTPDTEIIRHTYSNLDTTARSCSDVRRPAGSLPPAVVRARAVMAHGPAQI